MVGGALVSENTGRDMFSDPLPDTRLVTDGRQLVASASGYSTHSIGSRNLDLGIVTDADGDGRLDVLLPNEEQNTLAVVTRDDGAEGGAREIVRIALGAAITSNVSALRERDDGVAYAVGVADGRIRVWPGPGRT
jgi:hypothetical protein